MSARNIDFLAMGAARTAGGSGGDPRERSGRASNAAGLPLERAPFD